MVVFRYSRGIGEHNAFESEGKYDTDTPESVIQNDFVQWVHETVGENFHWWPQDGKIMFSYRRGAGENDKYIEDSGLDSNTPEAEIQEAYSTWMWNKIGDDVTWFKKQ